MQLLTLTITLALVALVSAVPAPQCAAGVMVASFENSTFTVTMSTTSPNNAFTISAANSCDDPNITVRINFQYTFTINANGFPFQIVDEACNVLASGSTGSVSYTFLPSDLTRAIYYMSPWNKNIWGQFFVLDNAQPVPANDGLMQAQLWESSDCTVIQVVNSKVNSYCDPIQHQAYFQCELRGTLGVVPVLYTCADCSTTPTTCDPAPQSFWPPNGGPCTGAPGGVGSYIFTCQASNPTPLPPPATPTGTPTYQVCSGGPCWPNCPLTASPTPIPVTATPTSSSSTTTTASTTTTGTTTTGTTTTGTTTTTGATATLTSTTTAGSPTTPLNAAHSPLASLALAALLLFFVFLL